MFSAFTKLAAEAEGQTACGQMVPWGLDLRQRGLLRASESLKADAGGVRLPYRALEQPFMRLRERRFPSSFAPAR